MMVNGTKNDSKPTYIILEFANIKILVHITYITTSVLDDNLRNTFPCAHVKNTVSPVK